MPSKRVGGAKSGPESAAGRAQVERMPALDKIRGASGDIKDNVPDAGGWVSHTSLTIHRPCRSVDGFHLVELRATADRAREVLRRM
jgi:hypothetical protein